MVAAGGLLLVLLGAVLLARWVNRAGYGGERSITMPPPPDRLAKYRRGVLK